MFEVKIRSSSGIRCDCCGIKRAIIRIDAAPDASFRKACEYGMQMQIDLCWDCAAAIGKALKKTTYNLLMEDILEE